MTTSLEALENVFDGWTFNGTVILNGAQRSEESVPIIRVLQRTIVMVGGGRSFALLRMMALLVNRATDY